MKQHIISIFSAALLLFPPSGYAQNAAMPFSRYSLNPESAAMAGTGRVRASSIAYTGFSDIASAMFSDIRYEAAASYQNYSPDHLKESIFTAGGAAKSGRWAAGVGVSYGMDEKYKLYDSNGMSNGTYRPWNMTLSGGAAFKPLKYLSIGANVKYIKSSIAESHSYHSVAFDFTVMGRTTLENSTEIKAAAGISDIGTQVKNSNGHYVSLPSSAVIAVGAERILGQKHGVEAEIDADYYFDDGFAASLGAAYTYNNIVSVRGGYHYGGDSVIPSHAAAGIGVKYWGVHLDFAYLFPVGNDSQMLKNTFCAGIGLAF